MASIFTKLWSKFYPKKIPFSIMIVGLDNSGKTSVLNYLMSSNSHKRAQQQQQQQQQQQHQRKQTRCQQQQKRVQTSSNDSSCSGDEDFLTTDRELHTNPVEFDSCSTQIVAIHCNNNSLQQLSVHNDNFHANVNPTIGYNYEQIQFKGLTLTVLDFSGQSKYRSLWQEFYDSVDGIVFVIDSSDLIRFVVVRDELECMLNHQYFTTLLVNNNNNKNNQKLNDILIDVDNNNRRRNSIRGTNQGNSLKTISTSHSAVAQQLTTQKQLVISQGKLIQSQLDTTKKFNQLARGANQSIAQQQQQKCRRRTKVPILFLANKNDLPNSVDTEVIVKALNLNQLPSDRHPWLIQSTSINSGDNITEGFNWLISHLISTPEKTHASF